MAKFKASHHSNFGVGRSEFERTQIAMRDTVRRLGYGKVPINDEALRPFLEVLWNFAKAHDEKVWTFDIPAQHPGRLYMGLRGGMTVLHPLQKLLRDMLLRKFPRAEIDRAAPTFQLGKGGQCTIYFEGVWVPADALVGRTH